MVGMLGLSCGMNKNSSECGICRINFREQVQKKPVRKSFFVQKGPKVRLISMCCEFMVAQWGLDM